jgi:hypothetical protein
MFFFPGGSGLNEDAEAAELKLLSKPNPAGFGMFFGCELAPYDSLSLPSPSSFRCGVFNLTLDESDTSSSSKQCSRFSSIFAAALISLGSHFSVKKKVICGIAVEYLPASLRENVLDLHAVRSNVIEMVLSLRHHLRQYLSDRPDSLRNILSIPILWKVKVNILDRRFRMWPSDMLLQQRCCFC